MATMMLTRPRDDNDAIAPVSAPTTYVLQPTPEHAEQVYLHLSEWLTWLRACRAQELVVDLSRARRLDFTAFGVFLAKVRDVLGIPVVITGAAAHLAHSLRQLDLLAGAEIETTRRPRALRRAGSRATEIQLPAAA